MEILDLESLSVLQKHLANLTGLYISLCGEKGNIILPPVAENTLLSSVRSSSKGKEEYIDFLKRTIDNIVNRNAIYVLQGPAGQYHFFAPVRVESLVFFVVGGGVYTSSVERDNFLLKDAPLYGLKIEQLKPPIHKTRIMDYHEIQTKAGHIQSVFNLIFRNTAKSNINEKKYRIIKTILNLLCDLDIERQAGEIYDVLIDVMLFLFNADSISIMTKQNNAFKPVRTAGRLKDYLQEVSLDISGILSEVTYKKKPLYCDSMIDILRLGLSDSVISVFIFPVIFDERIIGTLNVYNTDIHQEDAEIISEMCRLTGFLFRLIESQQFYNKCIREMDIINTASDRINVIKEPEMLYETILDTSVHITEAEKGSLMLLEDDASHLTIKAAKGINKGLLKEIKIKAGEGIAGKVFSEGLPIIVEDIEQNERILSKKRAKYRTGSFISIPLKTGDKTIGVLNISDKLTGEVFSEDDMVLLSHFASFATIALERSAYYSLVKHLRELSITDSMTGLFNRRYFEERFLEELHRSSRHNLFFSLVILDIDDFKLFNDTEGHLSGDELLKAIANIAKECLRITDVIARFGGEEFAVIMPQTDKEEAFLVSERIRNSVKKLLPKTWHVFPREYLTVSIGIASYPADGIERRELIRNADKALYRAKIEGKDRTIVWSI